MHFFMMDKLKKHKLLRGKAEKKYLLLYFSNASLTVTSHTTWSGTLLKGQSSSFYVREINTFYFMVKLFILKIFFDIFDYIFRQPNLNRYHCFNSEASHL